MPWKLNNMPSLIGRSNDPGATKVVSGRAGRGRGARSGAGDRARAIRSHSSRIPSIAGTLGPSLPLPILSQSIHASHSLSEAWRVM